MKPSQSSNRDILIGSFMKRFRRVPLLAAAVGCGQEALTPLVVRTEQREELSLFSLASLWSLGLHRKGRGTCFRRWLDVSSVWIST